MTKQSDFLRHRGSMRNCTSMGVLTQRLARRVAACVLLCAVALPVAQVLLLALPTAHPVRRLPPAVQKEPEHALYVARQTLSVPGPETLSVPRPYRNRSADFLGNGVLAGVLPSRSGAEGVHGRRGGQHEGLGSAQPNRGPLLPPRSTPEERRLQRPVQSSVVRADA